MKYAMEIQFLVWKKLNMVAHVVHGMGFLSGNEYVKDFCIVSLYLYWEIKY
jgi:hypothetical protein